MLEVLQRPASGEPCKEKVVEATACEGRRPLYLDVGVKLVEQERRVALARRPSGPKATELDCVSLIVDRPPALGFRKLMRITGH